MISELTKSSLACALLEIFTQVRWLNSHPYPYGVRVVVLNWSKLVRVVALSSLRICPLRKLHVTFGNLLLPKKVETEVGALGQPIRRECDALRRVNSPHLLRLVGPTVCT